YLAGGQGDDMIFGEAGNDVIQGDGSIDIKPTGTLPNSCGGTVGFDGWNFKNLVGACREAATAGGAAGPAVPTGTLDVNASVDDYGSTLTDTGRAGADGSDYIEGGAGNDVLFGDRENDNIVGGYGNMCTLSDTANHSPSANDRRLPPNPNFAGC